MNKKDDIFGKDFGKDRAMNEGGAPLSAKELVRACDDMGRRLQEAAQQCRIDLNGTQWQNSTLIKAEIKSLRQHFERFEFSDAYRQWSEKKRRILIARLSQQKKMREAACRWKTLDLKDRTKIIRHFTQMVQDVYSHSNILFPAKTIESRFVAQARPEGARSYFQRGHTTNGLFGWRCIISINTHDDSGFNEFYAAMDTAFHEGLHAVHFALMDYYLQCPDRNNHVLAEDMEMLYYAKQVDFKPYGRLLPLYHAIPWERDAHRQSKQFIRELREKLHIIERENNSAPSP